MRRLLSVVLVVVALMSVGTSARAAACVNEEIVWIFDAYEYTGGCLGTSSSGDLAGLTFDNGIEADNRGTALGIAAGYRVVLYDEPGFAGTWKDFVGAPSFVGYVMNDRASSIKILPDSCPIDAIVRVYVHSDYAGGCKTFDQDDRDFNWNTFDDYTWLNDQISSIVVKPGYRATLFSDAEFTGASRSLEGSTAHLGLFNDAVSSLVIQDLTPPVVQANAPPAILVAGVSGVNGSASDGYAGVWKVEVVFRPQVALSPETIVEAVLSCNDSARACDWSVTVPPTLLPGTYDAYARAYDLAGLSASGSHFSVVVV